MSTAARKSDLLVLVADHNMEAAVRGVLSRPRALGIRSVTADVRRHPERDSGCRVHGAAFLSAFRNQYEHAVLMFDREGCGQNAAQAADLETELEQELTRSGWGSHAAAIVIEPELDVWVWSDSPHVATEIGWRDRQTGLRAWLQDKGFLLPGQIKPPRPKEALEAVLREVRRPRSSALYLSIAKKVSLARCADPAFARLRTTLQRWFG